MDDNYLDPAMTLQADDPLRQWLAQYGQDPAMGLRLLTNPEAAGAELASRGIPPPSVMSYTDGMGTENTVPNRHPKGAPAGTYGGAPPPPAEPYNFGSINTGGYDATPIITRADGSLGNVTATTPPPPPANPPAPQKSPVGVPLPTADSRRGGTITSDSPLDPTPDFPDGVPVPKARSETGADPRSSTDISSRGRVGDAFTDLSKTLGAVKPVQPPAVSPVGTPGVRSPISPGAPNISQLLQVLGAQSKGDPITTLGKLLAVGRV